MAAQPSPKMAPVICRRANLHTSLPTAMTCSLLATTNNFLIAAWKLRQNHVLLFSSCKVCFFSPFAGKIILWRSLIVLGVFCCCFFTSNKSTRQNLNPYFSSLKRGRNDLGRTSFIFLTDPGCNSEMVLGYWNENGKRQMGYFFLICLVKDPRFLECFDLALRHQTWPQDLCHLFSPPLTVLIYFFKRAKHNFIPFLYKVLKKPTVHWTTYSSWCKIFFGINEV